MQSKVLWAIVGGFLTGIFARSFFSIPWPFAAFLFLLSLVAFAFTYFERTKRQQCIVVSVALIACAAGILRMDGATLRGDAELTAHLGETLTFQRIFLY